MENLVYLELNDNNLTGNVPEELVNILDNAVQLMRGVIMLNNNRLTGVVPAVITTHPKWKDVKEYVIYQNGYKLQE